MTAGTSQIEDWDHKQYDQLVAVATAKTKRVFILIYAYMLLIVLNFIYKR